MFKKISALSSIVFIVCIGVSIPGYADKSVESLIEAAKSGNIQRVQTLIKSGAVTRKSLSDIKPLAALHNQKAFNDIAVALSQVWPELSDRQLSKWLRKTWLPTMTYGELADHGYTHIGETMYYVNAKNKNGRTALMLASQKGHTEIAKALISAGADVNAKNNNSATALIAASEQGHTEIVEMLRAAGAKK